jgi:hypothetical protein
MISTTLEKFQETEEFQYSKVLRNTIQISRRTERTQEKWTDSSYPWVHYCLSPLPGCCGVVVSHNAYLASDYRGYGLGDYFHKERLSLMKDLGYSCGLCTVTSDNEVQKNLLLKNGWKLIHVFKNKRTGNLVEIWSKDIQ